MNFTDTDGVLSVGIVTSYNIYLNLLKQTELTCLEEKCEYMVNVSSASSSCSPLNQIMAKISAANTIGESPSIDLVTIGIYLLQQKIALQFVNSFVTIALLSKTKVSCCVVASFIKRISVC